MQDAIEIGINCFQVLQHSAVTHLRWGGNSVEMYTEFPRECDSDRTLKIGLHMPKLLPTRNVGQCPTWWPPCRI